MESSASTIRKLPETERDQYTVHAARDVDLSLRKRLVALLQESYNNVTLAQF